MRWRTRPPGRVTTGDRIANVAELRGGLAYVATLRTSPALPLWLAMYLEDVVERGELLRIMVIDGGIYPAEFWFDVVHDENTGWIDCKWSARLCGDTLAEAGARV